MSSESSADLASDSSVATDGHSTRGLLCEHVRVAVERYFQQLDGHEVNNLYQMVLHEVERPLIETVLGQCGYNQSKAAQVLGLSRSTLRKKMSQYGIV
jgi:Fis family transcriptional regulator, factor for inversion stimulation protein